MVIIHPYLLRASGNKPSAYIILSGLGLLHVLNKAYRKPPPTPGPTFLPAASSSQSSDDLRAQKDEDIRNTVLEAIGMAGTHPWP